MLCLTPRTKLKCHKTENVAKAFGLWNCCLIAVLRCIQPHSWHLLRSRRQTDTVELECCSKIIVSSRGVNLIILYQQRINLLRVEPIILWQHWTRSDIQYLLYRGSPGLSSFPKITIIYCTWFCLRQSQWDGLKKWNWIWFVHVMCLTMQLKQHIQCKHLIGQAVRGGGGGGGARGGGGWGWGGRRRKEELPTILFLHVCCARIDANTCRSPIVITMSRWRIATLGEPTQLYARMWPYPY